MKSIVSAAALAVVVSACALMSGAERAEASYLEVKITGYDFGFVMADLFFSKSDNKYDGFVSECTRPGVCKGSRVEATYAFTPTIYNPYGKYFEFGIPNNVIPSFLTIFANDSDINSPTFQITSFGDPYYSQYRLRDLTIETAVVDSISLVPIPAAAPLFGAALLALGGIGYAVRRRSAKPAML